MPILILVLILLLPVVATATELDLLPLGNSESAFDLGSAEAGAFYDASTDATVAFDEVVARMAQADVVLLGEEHTSMDQKLLHARLIEGMASAGRRLVLAMEFFQRDDRSALEGWLRGEIDERALLEETGWYDRGGYRWEYYRPVMEVARKRGISVVGVNVPREIPRAVNRGGLEALSDEQRGQVGSVSTDGSAQHRYLISRYFGDTVALLPPGWFDNMYAAQCLWDVVMARSILGEVAEDTTVVLVVGSGHVAYDLGISRRLREERLAGGTDPLAVVTFCPATAPAPPAEGEPTGHPMGGGGHGMGASSGPPAQFAKSLADIVAVFPDNGGIEAYPTLGLRLKNDDDSRPVVSMVWPDTLAEEVGFASGDEIVDVNGAEPADLADLRFLLAEIEWGQRLGLKVRREDETVEIAALLYPSIDTTEPSVAPGHTLETLTSFDPAASAPATEHITPDGRPEWVLVTKDGGPARVEVRIDGVLEQAHELDDDGRVTRSLHRESREDGAVEIRYERDDTGAVVRTAKLDRTGSEI